jgi:hypothetical protein
MAMHRALHRANLTAVLGIAGLLAGCANGGSTQIHGSMYAGVGYYDPWYWGPCCSDTVIVGPPPPAGERPGGPVGAHPEQPIAKPPPSAPVARPLPAPAPPRPVAAPRGGGGRRR